MYVCMYVRHKDKAQRLQQISQIPSKHPSEIGAHPSLSFRFVSFRFVQSMVSK